MQREALTSPVSLCGPAGVGPSLCHPPGAAPPLWAVPPSEGSALCFSPSLLRTPPRGRTEVLPTASSFTQGAFWKAVVPGWAVRSVVLKGGPWDQASPPRQPARATTCSRPLRLPSAPAAARALCPSLPGIPAPHGLDPRCAPSLGRSRTSTRAVLCSLRVLRVSGIQQLNLEAPSGSGATPWAPL